MAAHQTNSGQKNTSGQKNNSGLGPRLIVGLLMAVVAITIIWLGGVVFSALIAAGIALIFWEWCAMHQISQSWRSAGAGVLAVACGLAHAGFTSLSVATIMLAAAVSVGVAILANLSNKRWLATGLVYAGLPGIALIWMRGQPDGFALVMWAMGLVWATDILAYFSGRSIGGPKIWAAISPNKTWAGLIGGMIGAGLFSTLFAHFQNWPHSLMVMLSLGAALAVLAQAGDFFESWLKRKSGVKDSGSLFPGHGGIMDRVDGLVPVACVVALFMGYSQIVAAFTSNGGLV